MEFYTIRKYNIAISLWLHGADLEGESKTANVRLNKSDY